MKNPANNNFACIQIDKLTLLLANKKINPSAYTLGAIIVTNPGTNEYLSKLTGWSAITVKRNLVILEDLGYADKMPGGVWITRSALVNYNINIHNDKTKQENNQKNQEIDTTIFAEPIKFDKIVENFDKTESNEAEAADSTTATPEEKEEDQGSGGGSQKTISFKNIAVEMAQMFGLTEKAEQIKKIIEDVRESYLNYTYLLPDAVVQAAKYTITQIKKRFYRQKNGQDPVRNALGYFKYMIKDNMKKAVETELVRINAIGPRKTIGLIREAFSNKNKVLTNNANNTNKNPASAEDRVVNDHNNEFYDYIRVAVGDVAFDEYFKSANINKVEDAINIKVGNSFVMDWILDRYYEKLVKALKMPVIVVAD